MWGPCVHPDETHSDEDCLPALPETGEQEESVRWVLTRITLNSRCHLLGDVIAVHPEKLLLRFYLQSFAYVMLIYF